MASPMRVGHRRRSKAYWTFARRALIRTRDLRGYELWRERLSERRSGYPWGPRAPSFPEFSSLDARARLGLAS